MKQRGPYGYLCEIANPPFKFFVENATDEDGHPLLSEKDLGNGMKVFPIWREERPEVLPPTIGYVRHDFENDEIYFITNRDFESVILENREEWEQVTARYAIEWNACDQHIKVAEFHEKAHEAFSTWKYLPRDVTTKPKLLSPNRIVSVSVMNRCQKKSLKPLIAKWRIVTGSLHGFIHIEESPSGLFLFLRFVLTHFHDRA
jgi:hypothetical protein